MRHLVSVFMQPSTTGLLEPGLKDVTVSTLDQARANGQAQPEGPWVVQAVEPVAQVTVTTANGRCFLGCAHWLDPRFHRFQDLLDGATAESLLLDSAPLVGLMGPTSF